jgi:hypothetical protein
MGKKSNYWKQHEKDLKYTLLTAGLVLMAWGVLFEPGWLRAIRACYAMDGECQRAAVCNYRAIITTGSGFFILLALLAGYPRAFFKRQGIEIFLDLSVLLILILFLVSSQVRYFDNDEYEHLHNAWLMTQGTIPYFDVSMIHTPLLEWIIIAFMGITGERTILVQLMRFFIFLTSCVSLWLVYRIAWKLFHSRVHALVAVLLVLSNQVWVLKSPEIRPDNLMICLALASFWFLIRYYEQRRPGYLIAVGVLAVFSMMGKQDALIFYLPLGIIFATHWYFTDGKKKVTPLLVALGVLLILGVIPPVREFFWINIHRHLMPHRDRFLPWDNLRDVLSFNPAVFFLFLCQLFSPLRLADAYRPMKAYLFILPITALVFLFLMNQPYKQEMLLMVIFMGMTGANLLVEMMNKLDGKLKYVITMVLLVPVVHYLFSDAYVRTLMPDLDTTKEILRISKPDDLVFDSYGKPIFRHHPLEPYYLNYQPQKFNRLQKLKNSGVKYLIVDFYTRYLPKDTLDWLKHNFVHTGKSPYIYVRVKHPKSAETGR